MVFFLNAEGKVYARYGGRDAKDPDNRQSLEGLHYTMASVLDMHGRAEKAFAPRRAEATKFVWQIKGARGRGCMHCHQVREALNRELKRTGKWQREQVWRYPLPDNLGLVLEVDRGNVVKRVEPDSPAARAGLKPGDLLQRLGGVPIHSLGDAQFALDRAPAKGTVPLAWSRDGAAQTTELVLPEGWRKSDISWRPSLLHLVPTLPLSGADLSPGEKKALGLSPQQLAFRQRSSVHSRARAAGIRGGDIILGFDDRALAGMDVNGFRRYVSREYLAGDRVQVNVLRDGKRLSLPLTLQ
jgi:S1-C subfamily serine protease